MKYYCLGIKGAGMATLANILYDLGNDVVGYDDVKDHKFTQEGLDKRGIKIYSDNTHPLDKFDNHVSKDNIRVGENYILTIGNETGNDIVVKKYTIDSQGVLKETVLKNYSWDEVTCAMCK